MALNMLMMGHSMETYYQTNAAEYALMLTANHMANSVRSSHQEQEQDHPESMGDWLNSIHEDGY